MKISKIPGLGRFGIFIDDLDLDNISEEQWLEIGELHLKSLVTILRNVKLSTLPKYEKLINRWGPPRHNKPLYMYEKYGKTYKELILKDELDELDKEAYLNGRAWLVHRKFNTVRVTSKKNDEGRNMGIFGEGELLWHSNEAGDLLFTPGVALLGRDSMTNSCTGFLTTTDWYEEQTESFRSELDEMTVIHKFKPQKLNPDYVPIHELYYKGSMCPVDNTEIPLIIKSPAGITGLHLGINTFDTIKGMTQQQTQNFYDYLQKTLFVDKYIYEHWYKQNNDLCLFDNSITLHNRHIREGETAPDRVAWRIQFDYTNLAGTYNPYFQPELNHMRDERMQKLLEVMS